jgi:hypothetical protein
MPLAFTRDMASGTPWLMAANLSRARRRRFQPGAKDWLHIAHRLAAGLLPRAAALPERADEALVERLLAREEFRAVVEGSVEDLALSPQEFRARLVRLARQTLERALFLDDAPVALFILEEEARDRDPAATLADGMLKARDRALRPPGGKPPERRPRRRHRDPLQAMMHRGTARLRHDIQAEDAIRRSAPHHRRGRPPCAGPEAGRRAPQRARLRHPAGRHRRARSHRSAACPAGHQPAPHIPARRAWAWQPRSAIRALSPGTRQRWSGPWSI